MSAETTRALVAQTVHLPDPVELPTRILQVLAFNCVVPATSVNYSLGDLLSADFWCCSRLMTDKARRTIGLVIAPLLIVAVRRRHLAGQAG